METKKMESAKRTIIRHLEQNPNGRSLLEMQNDLGMDKYDLLRCLHALNAEGVVRETKNLSSLGLNSPEGARFTLLPNYRSKR